MFTFKPKLTEDCEGHVSPGTFALMNHQAEDTGQPNLRISLYLSHIGGFCVVTAAYTVQKTVQTSQYSEEKEKKSANSEFKRNEGNKIYKLFTYLSVKSTCLLHQEQTHEQHKENNTITIPNTQ